MKNPTDELAVVVGNMEIPASKFVDALADAVLARLQDPFRIEHHLGLNGHDAEVRAWLACYDRVEDALHVIESRAGRSKRRKRRCAPEIRALLPVKRTILKRLAAIGVHPMPFTEFVDYSRYEPIETVPTSVRENNGRVVEVVRIGFMAGDRVIRLQQCVVMRYTQPLDAGSAAKE